MRITTHIAALLLFAIVACFTVALQVRMQLRSYQLGRAKTELELLTNERDTIECRVEEKFTPAWIHQAALALRRNRLVEVLEDVLM